MAQMNLARGGVDRDGISRTDLSLRYNASARFLVVATDRVAVESGIPRLFYAAEIRDILGSRFLDSAIYLGRATDGAPTRFFGVDATGLDTDVLEFGAVRYNAHVWDALTSTLATEAVAVLTWHRTALFCERCGTPLIAGSDGWHRVCASGHLTFPRTDPAVIMAITDSSDRLLLGHNAAWAERKVSVLAGYVDAGEPAEEAVVREACEETGIEVSDVRFVASQPWPFPRSLMLAFEATTLCGDSDIAVDGIEMGWARFYSRTEFREAVASAQIEPPSPTSVASVLIERWLSRDEWTHDCANAGSGVVGK